MTQEERLMHARLEEALEQIRELSIRPGVPPAERLMAARSFARVAEATSFPEVAHFLRDVARSLKGSTEATSGR